MVAGQQLDVAGAVVRRRGAVVHMRMVSLDGRVLELDVLSGDRSALETSYTSRGQVGDWEITSCDRDIDEKLCEMAGIRDLEAFDVAGGVLELVKAEVDEGVIRNAFWKGRNRSLLFAGVGSLDQLVATIESLGIDDAETGLIVDPSAIGGWIQPPTIRKVVKDVGLLDLMYLGHPSTPPLPAWQGTETAPGTQMYRGEKVGTGFYVIIQGDVVASVVVPEEDEAASMQNSRRLTMEYVSA